MSAAYDEIIKILSDMEQKKELPEGTLKKIYDIERSVVHLLTRSQIDTDLRNVVVDATSKVK